MAFINFILITFTVVNLGRHPEAQIFRSTCRKDALFKVTTINAKLPSGLLVSKQTDGLNKCAKYCIDDKSSCISINFRKTDGQCELLEKNTSTATAQSGPGWNHYEPVYMVILFPSFFVTRALDC